jgi:hypothetical protein
MAHDDSRSGGRGSDSPQCVGPRCIKRFGPTGLDQHGDHGPRSSDLSEPGQIQTLRYGPTEIASDRRQVQVFVREISQQYDAASAGHGRNHGHFDLQSEEFRWRRERQQVLDPPKGRKGLSRWSTCGRREKNGKHCRFCALRRLTNTQEGIEANLLIVNPIFAIKGADRDGVRQLAPYLH